MFRSHADRTAGTGRVVVVVNMAFCTKPTLLAHDPWDAWLAVGMDVADIWAAGLGLAL